MARVTGVGLAVEAAKDTLATIIGGCDSVDTVLPDGFRTLPSTKHNVYVQPTTSITSQPTRGTLSMETFDLRFLVEAVVPWKRVGGPPGGQDAGDRAQLAEVKAARWLMANEIADAIAKDRRQLHTVSADVIVTSEDAGFVDNEWVARAWCVVRCANGPIV